MKGRNGRNLKVISSNTDIIDVPDLSSFVAYSPTYKLEDEEWFRLENFSQSTYANETIGINFSSTDYNQITKNEFKATKYFWVRQRGKFYYQRIIPSQVVSKKWFKISDEPELEEDESIIVLNSWADAVYVPGEDDLYFKEISRLKPIFVGIGELYREATNDEVGDFLESDFLVLAEEFGVEKVKIPNRKRIALAVDTLNSFNEEDKVYMFQYVQDYCDDLTIEGDAFEINTDEDLKKVLWGIEQRYYTTALGSEKRLANSIISLD
jgi:hypothetical protein